MAGTVVTTETQSGGLRKVHFAWTCDSAGAADATTTGVYNGAIMRAIFDSAADVTAGYDVVLNDSDGYDLLNGLGANLSATANVYKTNTDGLCMVVGSPLTLGVTNAGDAKTGVVIVYILEINQPG